MAAILARNEAARYLPTVIGSLRLLCDRILFLDDGSTDETTAEATALGCIVRKREGSPMWGQETHARQELWAWGKEVAEDGWLYIADADHQTVSDPATWQVLCQSTLATAWAFPLYDCWDTPMAHRADGYWQGYQHPRPWLFKPRAVEGTWNPRGMHCGHAPQGDWSVGLAPRSYIKHLGWMQESDRKAKHSRYLSAEAQLSEFERLHVASVLDE